MRLSSACLVAILALLPVVTTGSNYRLLASPVVAATVSVGDLAIGSVINVGGMNYVKINSNNVLAAASNFACPDGQWIAGKYVRCYDKNWDDLTITSSDVQVYGCQNPSGLMQTWDGCNSLATPPVGVYTQGPCLVDARDSKTYEVRKYADGKCWMVDNLAYGGDTALGGKDGCVAHPHSGTLFGARSSATNFFQSDGTTINYLDYEWDSDGTGKSSNFGTGRVLRGTFGTGTYGNCALAYNGESIKAFQTFASDGYTIGSDYNTYEQALAAVNGDASRVRPRGYHYEWLAVMQNPTAYYSTSETSPYVAFDSTQGICPAGWRVPTDASSDGEYRQLFQALGGKASGNTGVNDESALEMRYIFIKQLKIATTGYSHQANSVLTGVGQGSSNYWTAAETNSRYARTTKIWGLDYGGGLEFYRNTDKDYGFSVRCVKD